ncbi:MAG TPA: hypothetical protein VIH42_13950, partial [Thermoguttaceae bacterium]
MITSIIGIDGINTIVTWEIKSGEKINQENYSPSSSRLREVTSSINKIKAVVENGQIILIDTGNNSIIGEFHPGKAGYLT